MKVEFHNGVKCAKPVPCARVKVLAHGALCEQSKRVAYQMMAIKDLRDCGEVLALSCSGACPGLLLFIITV